LPSGIDVRLMQCEDFLRTQRVLDAPKTQAISEEWKAKLLDVAWLAL
jgi:hypothetical protein